MIQVSAGGALFRHHFSYLCVCGCFPEICLVYQGPGEYWQEGVGLESALLNFIGAQPVAGAGTNCGMEGAALFALK